MRDIYDLPVFNSASELLAVTCAEMEHWSETYGFSDKWKRARRKRTTANIYLLGTPFIVVDLPPDPTARKVFTPADPAEVWF